MAARLHTVNFRKAELDQEIGKLKAEAFTLSGQPTSPARAARLTEIEAAITSAQAELNEVLGEIAECVRQKAADIAASTLAHAPAPARGRKYAEMFPNHPLSRGGFESSEEFLATLHSGLADPRLIPSYAAGLRASMTGGVPSDGGFSVPTELFARWLDASLENEIVRPRCLIQPMLGSSGTAAGFDGADRSSTLFGGFAGSWVGEEGDITEESPKLRLIALKARKLAILTRASNELIADGQNFEMQLGSAISRALGYFLDSAFLTGTGASEPLGILNAPCTISIAKEVGQTAGTISYWNLCKMFARLAPESIANSVWVCNSTAIPSLLALSMPMGVGGQYFPVMSESDGTFRMLTRPCVFTDKLPGVGTSGDILLADFSKYVVGLRADFSLAKSVHAGFSSDTSYYRGVIRCDGMPMLNGPITPAHGDTVSPFVVLDDRT